MRKFSKTLAVMGLLTPLSAVALGIGEIRLKSALNQNLNAEIGLILSENESVSDIRVNLASPDAFRRADIDLAYLLHGLSFEVVPKADGQFAIKVSSRDAIREPFLNFLVEVSWPQGRMQREFTLLLDPPSTFKKGIVTRTAPHAVTPAADSPQPKAGDYGPVAAGENLWAITRKLSAGGTPSRGMMQEIFENNPHAFQRGNINALKQGVTLKVPGGARIAGVKPIPAKPGKELTLATPKQEGADAGKRKPGSSTKSEIALEVADTVKQENEDIRNRLAELEKQLATMQRLVSLKDQQLATLQSGQAGTKPSAVTPPAVPAEPVLKPLPPSAAQPPVVTPPAVPVEPALKPVPSPTVQPPAEPAPAPTPKPTVPPPLPIEEPGFFKENSGALAAGFLALLLSGLTVAIIRRRRAALLEIEEEEYAPATLLTSADNRPDKGRVAGLITPSQQGSFLSEFTPSDFDVLDSDNEAIDPLSEADVYLAYGRYQQAEELIKQAINENPFRDECKLKLLEVYYSAQNRQAFEQYASELADDGKSADHEFWSRVTAMGSTFCSDSALFGGTRPTPAKPVSASAQEAMPIASPQTALMDEMEINLDVPGKVSSSSLTGAARVDSVVPVEVDAHLTHDNAAVEETVAPLAEANEIEFDLSAFGTEDAGSETAASEVEKSGAAAERALLEFDFSSFEVSSLNEQGAGARPAASSSPATTSASFSGDIDSKIEFDAKTPVVESSDHGEVGDLTDMDEVETKLDLARAYVDMDDRQSARRLLEEIVTEGDNRQQEEARAMLASLALVA